MSSPKRIAKGSKGKSWFECPVCFDIFEATTSGNRSRTSCGCVKDNHAKGLTPEEKGRCRWLDDEIRRERDLDIPPLLLKLTKPRKIDPNWDQDLTLEARQRFIDETGPRPKDHNVGWKDPAGPICLENFEWKLAYEPEKI